MLSMHTTKCTCQENCDVVQKDDTRSGQIGKFQKRKVRKKEIVLLTSSCIHQQVSRFSCSRYGGGLSPLTSRRTVDLSPLASIETA